MNKKVAFILGLLLCTPYLMAPSGGFTSRPSFQAVAITEPFGTGTNIHSIRIGDTQTTTWQPIFTRNHSAANTAVSYWEIGNEVSGHEMLMYNTSTTYAGSSGFTNGPSGVQGGVGMAGGGAFCLASGTGNAFLCADASGVTTAPTSGNGAGNLTIAAGCTTTPTVAYNYTIFAKIVVLRIAHVTCTITGTPSSLSISGVPAAIQPINNQNIIGWIEDNSGSTTGVYQITGGNINASKVAGTAFSGVAGTGGTINGSDITLTYTMN